MRTVNELLTAAIKDIEEHGFDSAERVESWIKQIKAAIELGQEPDEKLIERLKASYTPKVGKALQKLNDQIPLFRKQQIKQSLYGELDRRILSASSLIKLRKEQAVNETLRRFVGWSTSIPIGGGDVTDKVELKQGIKKSLSQMSFIERRCSIDQAAKLVANIKDIVAVDSGAIAGQWHSHFRRPGYDFRKDHAERDGQFFIIRDSWADKLGLVKGTYTDEITMPSQEPFCQCDYSYYYKLNRLPDENLTKKGMEYLKR
ncbi:MAG: hypothetical protein RL755_70 [Pseudomonadota bacterium]|jgi:hypothetical protein